MALSLYDAYVPFAQRAVRSFKDILQKAEPLPNSQDFLQARLYENMYPLSKQVDVVSYFAFQIAADLTGGEAQTYDPTIESFEAAYALLSQAGDALAKVDRDVADKRTEEPTVIKASGGGAGGVEYHVLLKEKMIGYSIPSMLFHLSTGYAILRAQGVPLAKIDYLGQFLLPFADLSAMKKSKN